MFGIVFTVWWMLWSILHIAVLANFGFDTIQAAADSVTSNVLLAGFSLLIINNMRYYLPRKERYWYVLVISFALSVIWLLLVRVFLWLLYKDDEVYIRLLMQTSGIRFAIAFLLTGCMTMVSLLWYTQQEQKEADTIKQETEKLAREAELFKLRQQLQPHFLFNSLNSISALAGTQPEKARHMIQQLSDFLRGTLKKDEQQWIPLQEEIQYLQLYLEIEKVRFGHRLQTIVKVSEEAAGMKIPALLLQPVVENAIKFGLYDTTAEVTISIKAFIADKGLQLMVTNPYDAATGGQGTGFGLASIQRRLFLLFARNDLLQTTTEHHYFTTTIIIPQIKLS